jgi:hypothetical protein
MPRSDTLCPTLAEAAVRHVVSDVGGSLGQTRCVRRWPKPRSGTLRPTLAEAAVRHGTQSRMTVYTLASLQRASPEPEPKLGNWRFLEAEIGAEASIAATKLPCWMLIAEAQSSLWGSLGDWVFASTCRSGLLLAPSSRELPPT